MNEVLTAFFSEQIFPQSYFLLLVSFGICASIIYTVYTYFFNKE